MRILHISADYPDPLVPDKTSAISRLLALTPEREHRVWSLNRAGWRPQRPFFAQIETIKFADASGEEHRALVYPGAPRGVGLARWQERLAERIVEEAAAEGYAPDLVHAHKLTVEGPIGAAVADRLGVPLALSMQGDTDLKLLGARPDLHAAWRGVWRKAAVVFPFAPWTRERVAARLGPREGLTTVLPCATLADELRAPRLAGPVFRSAFHLGSADRKNARTLIAAVGQAARAVPDIRLEILGGGDPAAFARLAEHARAAAPGRIAFLGAVPNDRVQARFNASCAFALPSRRESFGMVFVEALLAGAPCLIPRGWGIDGYLPEEEATLAAEPSSVDAVADGLARLSFEESAFKARLARLQETGGLDLFRRDVIAAAYRRGLDSVLSKRLVPT